MRKEKRDLRIIENAIERNSKSIIEKAMGAPHHHLIEQTGMLNERLRVVYRQRQSD